MAKNNLSQMLSGDENQIRPVIRRGQGMTLSTESPSADVKPGPKSESEKIAQSHNRTIAPNSAQRVNRGYRLREDLVRACKAAAAQQGKKLYQIMEEAMRLYLAENMTVLQLKPESQQLFEPDKLYYLLEGWAQATVTHHNGVEEMLTLKQGAIVYGDDYQTGYFEAHGSQPLTLLVGEIS